MNDSSHWRRSVKKNYSEIKRKSEYSAVTGVISRDPPTQNEIVKAEELYNYLINENQYETGEDAAKRVAVISEIKQLVDLWVEADTLKKGVLHLDNPVAQIYVFGSYRLQVHTKGTDLDILCVAPQHIERSSFFNSFMEILEKQKKIKNLRAIQDAFVPVIKMTFDGIEIDMLFAKLALETIPENLDLSDNRFLKYMDQKCIRSLNGSRITDAIYASVPDKQNFQLALRAIKLWAKRHGLYSNILGFLGGAAWAILLARICQLYPAAPASTLLHKFFYLFTLWRWPNPILLKTADENTLGLEVWDPRINVGDRYHLMPIITPVYPQQNSAFNVSFSTMKIILNNIKDGHAITSDILDNKCGWEKLFEPINFFSMYKHFIVITISANTKEDHLAWHGLVQVKIRKLAAALEKYDCMDLVHVNTEAFASKPNHTMWIMGLQFLRSDVKVNFTQEIQRFNDLVIMHATAANVYKVNEMSLKVEYVRRKDLSKYLPRNLLGKRRTERALSGSNSSRSSDDTDKKRQLDDSKSGSQSKRRASDLDNSPTSMFNNTQVPLFGKAGSDSVMNDSQLSGSNSSRSSDDTDKKRQLDDSKSGSQSKRRASDLDNSPTSMFNNTQVPLFGKAGSDSVMNDSQLTGSNSAGISDCNSKTNDPEDGKFQLQKSPGSNFHSLFCSINNVQIPFLENEDEAS